MIRYLSLKEAVELHQMIVDQSGGLAGIRDQGGLESALAQPQLTFDSVELYPDIPHKAAALAYSLVCNHPFNDGNKRIGHAVLETFLVLNGYELNCDVSEQEQLFLQLAAGRVKRDQLVDWIVNHLQLLPSVRN